MGEMAQVKRAEPNARTTEGKVSPLSLPLDKESSLPDENETGASELESKEMKRKSQKKFADVILKRVDERIAQRRGRRRLFPQLGIILLVLFTAPFFFRAGSDMYDVLKSKLPYYLEFYGLDFPSTPGDGEPDSAAVNRQIAPQKVVIIYPEQQGTFSFKREKKRLYELSGLDIDDPVRGSSIIGKIKSVELLALMVESFDRIIDNAGKKKEVSWFHVKNAREGKQMALERIRQLR